MFIQIRIPPDKRWFCTTSIKTISEEMTDGNREMRDGYDDEIMDSNKLVF